MKKVLVNYLNEIMGKVADILQEDINKAGGISKELKSVSKDLNFYDNAPKEQYKNELFAAYYLYRYGYAYAFEYATLYEVVLKSYLASEEPIFGVCSIGCGSLIDAWALAYSKAKLSEEGNQNVASLSFRYYGVDKRKWPIIFGFREHDYLKDNFFANNPRYPGCPDEKDKEIDLFDFFRGDEWYSSYNAILFSKILNELTNTELEDLINIIKDATKRERFKNRKELYICVSHSKSKIVNDDANHVKAAQRIVEAINTNDEFEVEYDLLQQWNDTAAEEKHTLKKLEIKDTHCYEFFHNKNSDDYEYIESINSDFKRITAIKNIDNLMKKNDFRDKSPIIRTSQIVLELIKLTRK